MITWQDHLREAVRLKGSQAKLADAIGCSQSKIDWLLRVADKISAEDALLVERAVEGAVTRAQLRPDLPWEPCGGYAQRDPAAAA